MTSIADRIHKRMKIGDFIKVSELARALRVRRDAILDAVYDDHGLDLCVGSRTFGGIVEWRESDWQVEKYDDPR